MFSFIITKSLFAMKDCFSLIILNIHLMTCEIPPHAPSPSLFSTIFVFAFKSTTLNPILSLQSGHNFASVSRQIESCDLYSPLARQV